MGICTTSLKKACRRNGISRWPHKAYKIVNERMAKANSTTFDQQMLDTEIRKLIEKKKSLFDDPAFATFRIQKSAKEIEEEKAAEIHSTSTENWSSVNQVNLLTLTNGTTNGTTKGTEVIKDVNNGITKSTLVSEESRKSHLISVHPVVDVNFDTSDIHEKIEYHSTLPPVLVATTHRNGIHPHKINKIFLPHMLPSISCKNSLLTSPIEISSGLPNPKLVQRLTQITLRLAKQNVTDSVNLAGIQPFYRFKGRPPPRPPNLALIDPREYFAIQELLPPFGVSLRNLIEPHIITPSIHPLTTLYSSEPSEQNGVSLNIESDESNELSFPNRKRRKLDQSLSRSY
jgi:hypothetical protein